ncbi:MAG: NAD(P)-binding domain-containing protein, partial [bacterium]|nr:NAD(P)-binding domain-containing protein [bacterium]
MSMIKQYFQWLQKDVPTGDVEKYPEIDANGDSSVKGIYIIGDLTGIPLLKMAADSGTAVIRFLQKEPGFKKSVEKKAPDVLDILIVGAGPSGIAAGMETQKAGLSFKIIESAAPFNTIANFPKGKPIYAEPLDIEQIADLKINEGVKEEFLDDLNQQIKDKNLPIERNFKLENIVKKGDLFEVTSKESSYKALRIILATGKSGNSRKLNVPGEELDKVYNRLIDPADATGHDVLVVGGGDFALETAIAVTGFASSVTLSYRKASFARPKEGNVEALDKLIKAGKITLKMESMVKEITPSHVVLIDNSKQESSIANSMVFALIGKQLPLDFFKKINVKMEGALSFVDKLMFAALLLFSGVIYFGKAGMTAIISAPTEGAVTWGYIGQQLLTLEFWKRFFTYPLSGFWKDAGQWNWINAVNGVLGYLSFLAFIAIGLYLLIYFFRNIKTYTASSWKSFKHFYFICSVVFFCFIYFGSIYFGLHFLGKPPYFWYSFLYTLTILVFGLRRMTVNPTTYIKRQTVVLILIQAFPLFLLPELILPIMSKAGLLGGKEGFLLTQVFPGGDFGHAYRLIFA